MKTQDFSWQQIQVIHHTMAAAAEPSPSVGCGTPVYSPLSCLGEPGKQQWQENLASNQAQWSHRGTSNSSGVQGQPGLHSSQRSSSYQFPSVLSALGPAAAAESLLKTLILSLTLDLPNKKLVAISAVTSPPGDSDGSSGLSYRVIKYCSRIC